MKKKKRFEEKSFAGQNAIIIVLLFKEIGLGTELTSTPHFSIQGGG